MNVIKTYESGEFWGATYSEPLFEIKEEYTGEIKDWVLEQVMEAGADAIPTYRTIESEFEIEVKDYLSNKDIKDLEDVIENMEGFYND